MLTKKGELDKRYKWFCFSHESQITNAKLYELIEQFYSEIAPRFCLGSDLYSYSYPTLWGKAHYIIAPSKNHYDVHCQWVPAFLFGFENEDKVEEFKIYRNKRRRTEQIDEILKDL